MDCPRCGWPEPPVPLDVLQQAVALDPEEWQELLRRVVLLIRLDMKDRLSG